MARARTAAPNPANPEAANLDALVAPFRGLGIAAAIAPDFLRGAPPELFEAARQVALAAVADCQANQILLAAVSFETAQYSDDDGPPTTVDVVRLQIRATGKAAVRQLARLSLVEGQLSASLPEALRREFIWRFYIQVTDVAR